MSTLSSSSTYAQVSDAYQDNASWEEDESVSKARAFITACRFLIHLTPSHSKKGEEEIDKEVAAYRQEMEAARAFVATAGPTAYAGGVTHASFQDMPR